MSNSTRWVHRVSTGIAVIALLIIFVWDVNHAFQISDHVMGHEKERIARNIANGHGFSFKEGQRWLFDEGIKEGYQSTAWLEPIYPATLGAFFWAFGEEQGKLVMLLLHALTLLLTGWMVYMIAHTLFGPLAGPAAAFAFSGLMIYQRRLPPIESIHSLLNNAPLGGLVMVVCVFGLIKLIQQPSLLRSMFTGVILGLSALSYASLLTFTPFAATVLLFVKKIRLGKRLAMAVLLTSATAATFVPWAARNHDQFGYWIPVRTGSGQILHTGNVSLAATFAPDAVPEVDRVALPWSATSINDALQTIRKSKHRRALERWQHEYVKATAPEGYDGLNEHERDRECSRQVRTFVFNQPMLFIKITMAKAWLFGFSGWPISGLLLVFALCGALFIISDPRTWIVLMAVASYTAPYILSIPLFYRYRYPIDPLLCVLAAGLFAWVGRWLLVRWDKFRISVTSNQ